MTERPPSPPDSERVVDTAAALARRAHSRQLYGDKPYFDAHLLKVAAVLRDFGFGPRHEAAGLLHDVVEDCGITLDRLRAEVGEDVAAMVWACTGVGEDRAARNRSIYAKLAACPAAAPVKLADRIANVEAAPPGSRHRLVYRDEAEGFAAAVRPHVPASMWERLERALDAGEG